MKTIHNNKRIEYLINHAKYKANLISDVTHYFDENFKEHTVTLTGLVARIFQHEYDHIEGVLFIDKISPLKKRLLKKQLEQISKGIVDVKYKMRFFKK